CTEETMLLRELLSLLTMFVAGFAQGVDGNIYNFHKQTHSQLTEDESIRQIRDQIKSEIFHDYLSEELPREALEEPTPVKVQIDVTGINSIDVMNMKFTIDMYLRQRWNDPRLKWDPLKHSQFATPLLLTCNISTIWLPDLFFRNGKS
ncbi:hypothetical protein Ciccas_013700, partial [Cichlidogyrus casuarinus]